MRGTLFIYFPGMKAEEYAVVMKKHLSEFNLKCINAYPAPSRARRGEYYLIVKGDKRNVVSFISYLSNNGYIIEVGHLEK